MQQTKSNSLVSRLRALFRKKQPAPAPKPDPEVTYHTYVTYTDGFRRSEICTDLGHATSLATAAAVRAYEIYRFEKFADGRFRSSTIAAADLPGAA